MLNPRSAFVLLVAIVVTAACYKAQVTKVEPLALAITEEAVKLELRGAEIATLLVCTDSLGQPMAQEAATHCMPCVPTAAQRVAAEGHRHARRLWQQLAKAPYNNSDGNAHCVRLAYEFAILADSADRTIRIDHAVFQLASADVPVRTLGLATLDSLLDAAFAAGDTAAAEQLLHSLGASILERAQRMHMSGGLFGLDDREKQVHQLIRGAPTFRRLPAIPHTSDRLGASEARWASHIYRYASEVAMSEGARARYRRLSLTPFVLPREWRALDSAAASLLERTPHDSVAGIARALAKYKLQRRMLHAYRDIELAFDEALRWMPDGDSAAYDNFDEIFSAQDDEWRYGFLPGIRQQLDRRAWAIVDPLWSTPVNELRLTRRARKAEADFLYANITRPAQSGSETDPGILLVKGGPPSDSWQGIGAGSGQSRLMYSWGNYRYDVRVWRDDDIWRVFYGDMMAPAQFVQERSDCGSSRSLVECARRSSATWNEVVFYGRLDTIDVSLSRFRARNDSVDLYVGARIPLRGFRHRGTQGAQLRDSVTYGLWVSSSFGTVLHRREATRRLPGDSEIAWYDQWTVSVGDGNIMHRVEAIDRRHARGARGAALLTSADAAVMHLSGFGVSDVLAADKVSPRRALLNTWRDLDIVPNGGVVAPRVPIALAWEIYDLARGEDGLARWRVRLKREDGTLQSRFDAQSLIIGAPNAGTQVIASEPNASDISYTRTEPARSTAVEYMRFNLSDAMPGRHVLVLTVEDLVAKRTTQRSVSLRILPPMMQNRENGGVPAALFDGFRLTEMPQFPDYFPRMRR